MCGNNHVYVLKPKGGLSGNDWCYSLMLYDTNGLINGAIRQMLILISSSKSQKIFIENNF